MRARSGLVGAVYAPTALLAFGQGVLLPTLPLYADAFDASYAAIRLVVSAAAIGTLRGSRSRALLTDP